MKKNIKNIIGFVIGAILCLAMGLNTVTHSWAPVAFYGIFCLLGATIFLGYAWEEWEELRARRANAKRNVELSRR